MLVRAEDYDSLKTVEDMAGKKVGAQLGSLQQGILEEPDIEIPVDGYRSYNHTVVSTKKTGK